MQALLLCCLVALAVCQEKSYRYDLSLNPQKTYEYQYEGQVRFGLEKPNRAESGARMKAQVKITGISADNYRLKFSNVAFEEYNGVPGNSDYVAVEELARRIAEQLSKPISFRYSAGNVGDIRASPEVTDTAVNIARGFLGFFQVTIKTTQEIYELEEVGIHGKCLSSYAIKTNERERVMDLTQVVDVTNCREKAAFYTGLANAVENKYSKQRGESSSSTVKYTYNIKGSQEGGVITKAQALELQYLSPFNVKKGTFRMEAKKELVLTSVKDKTQDNQEQGQMDNRGNLMYKIVKNNANIPIVMQKSDDPKSKASELIKRLAQANAERIDSTTTEDTIKLYQLLRMIPQEKLMQLWDELKGNSDQRRWFLHTVVEVNDERALNFLEQYLRESESSSIEAVTVIVQAFNHLQASSEMVEEAKKFLNKDYRNSLIRQTVVLSYGSLVYRHCSYNTPCSESAIRPLMDMAEKSRSSNDKMEKILALKALGNAGHPRSLKTITRFLPGVDPNPDQVDKRPRVVSAAVQAMRLITNRDPHGVQSNTLKLFLNRELESELRMLALMIMFDTKPSMALVSTVAAHLLEERDMQVVNFANTYLRSLARASTPDNHYLSTAASVAAKILAPKFGHLGYYTSRATRLDFFSGDYLIGSAVEAYILKRASQLIPAEMMVKSNFQFIGRILQLVEFGIRPEGIRDLFGANIPGFRGDMSMSDFQAIYNVLKKWETLPEDKPIFSFHTRVSGQEFYYKDFSKDLLKSLKNRAGELSQSIGKDNSLWSYIEKLIQGYSWHGNLPFLTAEARYIQATTLGLPMEVSKYYHVVSGMAVNAKARMSSNSNDHLKELLKSEVSVKADGYIGYTKDLWLFYGVNTELFQSAVEIKAKNPVAIPFNFQAKANYNARKYEIEAARSNKEFELFSFRSNAYAISRNIIKPEAAKKAEIVRDQSASQKYSNAQQRDQPDRWDPDEENCSNSSTYGLSICTEMALKREYYREEYPLYYFLGFTHFALKVKPVQGSPVERIRLEINVDPSSQSENERQFIDALRQTAMGIRQSSRQSRRQSSRQSSSSASQEQQDRKSQEQQNKQSQEQQNRQSQEQQNRQSQEQQNRQSQEQQDRQSQEQQDRQSRGNGGSAVPMFQIKALAESSSRQQGYDTRVFYTSEGQSYSTQMITSRIGNSSSNWKMCFDAAISGEAEASIGWGEECKTYAMFMRAAYVATNRPQARAYFNWKRVPENMEEYGRRIARYTPGMAYLMGFNERQERNARQEVSASITAASADSVNVKIKFPEYTLCREALAYPLPPAYFRSSNGTNNNNAQA